MDKEFFKIVNCKEHQIHLFAIPNCDVENPGFSFELYKNKQIINETPYPYSNIKTRLYFTSSMKKPVKIISYDNNNQDIRPNSNFYQNIENAKQNNVLILF